MFSPHIGTAAIIGGIFGDGMSDGLLGVVSALVASLVWITQRNAKIQMRLVANLCRAVDHFAVFERQELDSHAELFRSQADISRNIEAMVEAQTTLTRSVSELVERLRSLEAKVGDR